MKTTNKLTHRKKLLSMAISLSLLPLATPAFSQQDSVEEVVVTGTFIRRSEGFTGASSITQLNAEDLENEGTLNLGEVIQNLSFVNGSASAVTNTVLGESSTNSQIDLRGLGARSTLTLLDGKRLVNENINTLIPTIAIQRMDIVADGAAALYGSEAVAGVVNFIPYKSYDGLKVDTFVEQDTRGDYDEHSVQALWGGDIGEVDVVLAGQFRANSRLAWDERRDLTAAGLSMSGNGPGNWLVPVRDQNGMYTGDQVSQVEPSCPLAADRAGLRQNVANNPFGANLNGTCFFDYSDGRSTREPTETNQFYGNATWEANDDLALSLQGYRTRFFIKGHTSTSDPGASRIFELPAARGEIPGNPFFATDSLGNQLYGVDANGDGIPDRNAQDLNNDGWGDYIVSGTAPNGVLLHEDVVPRTFRPVNKTHRQSNSHLSDMDNITHTNDTTWRYSVQADFTVPFVDGWEGVASYTNSERERRTTSGTRFDITAMQQGLRCDVANDRDACYNPFFVVDQADQNTLIMMDAITARGRTSSLDRLDVIDIIFNGELPLLGFELPGGPIGAAVGYQRRSSHFTNTPHFLDITGDAWRGGTEEARVTRGNREVDAYFMELAVPVLPNLEVELAIRREEFSTGQSSTDPKFGVSWAATDWLTLSATKGDAFIVPTLEQLLNPVTCGSTQVTDRFSPFQSFIGSCGGGNEFLENETSKSEQLGLNIALGDFDFSLTWNQTDFQNRIISVNGQDIMDIDFTRFKNATGFTGSGIGAGNQPSEQQLADWIANPLSNKDIIRDPRNISEVLRINNTSTANAETVKVEAYDIQANYRFTLNNWGDFRLSLQATNIDHFYFQGNETQPVRDGAGKYNNATAAAPALPEWKANLRLGWTRGNHSVMSTVRYIDAIPYDGPSFGHWALFGNNNLPIGMTEIRAWTDFDASYTYRGISLFDGEAAFTLGSRNLFDRQAQSSPEIGGVIGELQDPMGRSIYARFIYDF
ncbi:MAG: TonB-dependent receptor [Pseudohongiellaceae bacterium]